MSNARDLQRDRFASLLRECGRKKSYSDGKLVQTRIVEAGLDTGTFLGNLIVQMYGKLGDMKQSSAAFERITEKNVFTWTLMFTAYAQNGYLHDARRVFDMMPGKDVVAWTAMLAAYSQNGLVENAKELFDRMPEKDLPAWNAMLAAYGQNLQYNGALLIYRAMHQMGVRVDGTTFVSVLDVCVGLRDLAQGEAVHETVIYCGMQLEASVETALVNMYGKLGSLSKARSILDSMLHKNVIAWTAMITAYTQNGDPYQSINLFLVMDQEGFPPDDLTYVSVLSACTSVSAFTVGRLIHDSFRYSEFASARAAPSVGNSLVTFYARCGSLEQARSVFDGITQRSLLSWNSMMGAYAHNGKVEETLELYLQMLLEGLQPDEITFVSVLSACSRGGLLREGCYHFSSIAMDYGQVPAEEHLTCVLDLLARAGQLEETETLLNRFSHLRDGWTALLSACKIHGDSERGAKAGHNVVKVEEGDEGGAGSYMLLSHIYAT